MKTGVFIELQSHSPEWKALFGRISNKFLEIFAAHSPKRMFIRPNDTSFTLSRRFSELDKKISLHHPFARMD